MFQQQPSKGLLNVVVFLLHEIYFNWSRFWEVGACVLRQVLLVWQELSFAAINFVINNGTRVVWRKTGAANEVLLGNGSAAKRSICRGHTFGGDKVIIRQMYASTVLSLSQSFSVVAVWRVLKVLFTVLASVTASSHSFPFYIPCTECWVVI